MIVDLVRTTTADGVRLDGALYVPRSASDETALPKRADAALPSGADAVLLLHGTGASFYASSLLEAVAQHFQNAGCAALLANTRGRDIVYTASTSDGPRRLGAAYELVDDCLHDLAAWLGWLRERGFARIGVIGHSLGAIKAVYALTQDDPTRSSGVAWLCAISPARLSYDYFCGSPAAEQFRTTLQQSQQLVEAGRPETLMEVQFPIPYVVTAGGYCDKYGPGERFNVLTHIARLRVPTLFTFGGSEVQSHVAFRGLPEAIEAAVSTAAEAGSAAKSRAAAPVEVAVITGGDHVYSGVRSELLARIDRWLRKLEFAP